MSLTPVYNAINKRLLIFGIERQMFWVTLAVGVAMFYYVGLIAAVAASTLIFTGASLATKEDAKLPEVLINSIKLGCIYDSALKK